MPVKASESLYNFIKKSEGFRAKPYIDAGGKTAVGYGTSDGKVDKPVSEDEANRLMRQRVSQAESELSAVVTRKDLSENQQNALIDMHYNLGGTAMNINGFIDLVNSGRDSEVSQQIQKYTKARNNKTGELEELPGLVNRVKQRSLWWNGVQVPEQAIIGLPNENTNQLIDSMEAFDRVKEEADFIVPPLTDPDALSQTDQQKIINRSMDQFDAIGVIAPENVDDRIRSMNNARGIISSKESNRSQMVKQLSSELGIDPLIVDADLEIYSEEEIRTRAKIPDVAKQFPVLARWAARPENYVLMENTGDWTTSLTVSADKLNKKSQSDFEKTVRSSILEYPKAATYTLLLYGAINPKQAQESIGEINRQQNDLSISDAARKQVERLQRVEGALTPKLTSLVESIDQAWDAATNDDLNRSIMPELKGVYDGSADSLSGILDYLSAMYENPTGAGLTTAQAAVSSGLPIAVGVGGAAVGRPVLGALGAFSSSAMLSVSESIQKDLEEFRDPNTGEIDLEAAFSNPERVARWRKRAGVYGAVMGLSDMIYSKFVGKGFVKIIKQGGKAAVVKGAATEVAAGAVEEGASQFTASVAREASSGDLTTEKVGEAAAESVTEAVYGGIIGGSIGSTSAVLNTGKQKFYKIKASLDEANKASNDMFSLHETRTVLAQDETAKTNPAQVKELIDLSTEVPPVPSETGIYEDPAEGSESLALEREQEAVNGMIQVSPSELVEFFNDQNLNPEDEMRKLPSGVYDQYLINRESDSSVNIDVSDWLQVLEEFPEVDEIVRINGNDLNAREANEVIENIQKDPFQLYQDIIDGDPDAEIDESVAPPVPLTPEEQELEAQSVINVPSDPSEIITLSEIKTKFRSEDDTKAFNTIKSRLTKATSKIKSIPTDAASTFAEIQYARVKNRAEILGRDALELARSQKVTTGRSDKVFGSFNTFFNSIFLGDKANSSTVIHEFGHSWLDEMSEDYIFLSNVPVENRTSAQNDYFYSMEVSAKLLGLDNIGILNGMDKSNPEYTNAHEKFAQTSEEYFLSGDFKGSRVKAAMEAFRKYMVNIIESIRRYAAKSGFGTLQITPEVERMFEGIIGVDNNIDEVITPMFPDPMFDPALLGAKAQEYYNTTRDALAESVGVFASRIMKSSYKEREKLIDSALNSAFDKASNIVDSRPEMILGLQMKDQYIEFRERTKKGEKLADPRISFNSFAALFSDPTVMEDVKDSLPNYIVAGKKKGGTDATLIMYNLGITDPNEFVNILTTIGDRDSLVDIKAQEIINEEYPILLNDQQIKDDAVESLSNSKVTKFLQMEMKILATNYLPTLKNLAEMFITPPETMMRSDVVDNKASEMVTTARAYKFSANSFRVDYGRLARKSARFFKQGDFANAFDSKVKSAIAYRANVFGQAAQRKLATTSKRIKQFKKYSQSRDYAKKYNTELMLYGKAVLDAVENNAENLPRIDIEMFPSGSGVTQNSVDNINQAVKRFTDRSGSRLGVFISVGTYVELGELTRMIQKQARNAKQVEVGNKKIALEEITANVANEIESSTSRAISYEPRGYGNFKIAKDTMYTVFSSLYPSDLAFSNSTLGSILTDLEDAQADRNLQTRADVNRVIGNFEKIAKASPKGSKTEELLGPIVSRVTFAGSVWNYGKGADPIVSGPDEIGITFNNLSEYIIAELLMGSPSGAEKFLRGGTITSPNAIAGYDEAGKIDTRGFERLRNRLIREGLLKKEHFVAMQDIWDMMREKHPQIKKAFRDTDGYLIGNIEGWDVQTPWGIFKGGYMPISQDKQLSEQATFESLIDPDTNHLSASSLFPTQNTNMTNQRKDRFFPIDLDPNRILLYVAATNDLIHMRAPLLTLGKTFLDPNVRGAFETKRPGAFKNMLTPWYDRVKNQQRSERVNDILSRVATKIKANVNRSIYLFRLMTPLKQVFGLIPAAAAVSPKHLVPAILETSLNPVKTTAEVARQSKVMRERFEATVRRHISDWEDLSVNFDWVQKADEMVDKVTFMAIQFMQNKVDTAIWLGAFEQAGKAGLNEAKSIHFADTAVQSTQAGSTISYLNNFQTRSALSKFIQGIATSYIFAINNVVTKKAMRSENATAQARIIIGLGLALYLIPNIMDQSLEELFRTISEGEDDDEDIEDKMINIAKRSAMGSLSTIMPIVGNTVSSFMYSGNVDFAPIFTKLQRESTLTLNGLTKNTQGVNMTAREIKALLNTITIFSGIPTSALAKDIFVEDVYIEGLSGESLDDRIRERKFQLRRLKFQEGRRR